MNTTVEDNSSQNILHFSGIDIDKNGRTIKVDGLPVELTKSEYALLLAMTEIPGKAFSQRELLSSMWGSAWTVDTTPLQVHISRLRDKLKDSVTNPRFIQTVRGYGYRFIATPENLNQNHMQPEFIRANHNYLGHDSAPVSLIVGMNREIQWADSGITALLGFTPDGIKGKNFYEMVHSEFLDTALELKKKLDTGNEISIIVPLQTVSGEYRNIKAKVLPISGPDSKPTAFFTSWESFNEDQSDIETALYTNLGQELPEGIVQLTFDEKFILRKIDPEMEFLGWKPKEILNTFFSPLGATIEILSMFTSAMITRGQYEIATLMPANSGSGDPYGVSAISRILTNEQHLFNGYIVDVYLNVAFPLASNFGNQIIG